LKDKKIYDSGMKSYLPFTQIILSLLLAGCASVPRATADEQEEMAVMVLSARDSQIAALGVYFSDMRSRVDKYIVEEWAPDFTKDYVRTSTILTDIRNMKNQRAISGKLADFSAAVSEEIYERRISMMNALNGLEKKLREKIVQDYSGLLLSSRASVSAPRSASQRGKALAELSKTLELKMKSIPAVRSAESRLDKLLIFKDSKQDLYKTAAAILGLAEPGEDHAK
jgi:hypothetical protein